ncbi:Der GTPase-activating protein YihI [Shewanella algicola]|uniref:Der GTPase-activating protein YihI n=1 Tax=Shewanella algicola TaxID=640633 RepID=A0A9X1Z6D5_9GAMM|nr:Der GTPase-activating protein YihI [Shewanella algicola]MCL1104654.1 Der GTPase-activating protein YihI [Shewanella algicola]GGP54430.1 Der GTPase-activating protein YihI [Shewanella algicola]
MARSKKTRKGGENGPKFAPRVKKTDRNAVDGKKSESGRKSGSRHNEALLKQASGSGAAVTKDARHGSKKPVALSLPTSITEPLVVKPKQPKITDEQKLLKLEEDPRLNQLLDQLEEGRDLSDADQKWLDAQLDKIEQLMQRLGLTEGGEAPAPSPKKQLTDDELLNRFESGADLLKDYKKQD